MGERLCLKARSLLPTPSQEAVSAPTRLQSRPYCRRQAGFLHSGTEEEFSFQRKYEELLSPRASLVPSRWAQENMRGKQSCAP